MKTHGKEFEREGLRLLLTSTGRGKIPAGAAAGTATDSEVTGQRASVIQFPARQALPAFVFPARPTAIHDAEACPRVKNTGATV